jgi:hypothetical protein
MMKKPYQDYNFKDLDGTSRVVPTAVVPKKKVLEDDAVNHPNHYTTGEHETIDIIEDWNLDYHVGNAVKYLSRAGKKDPKKYIEDLQKAIWYLERKIMLEENS